MFLSFMRKSRSPAVEARSTVPVSDTSGLVKVFGLEDMGDAERVTIESALGVPAVFAAVNFLAATVAGLPLKVYRKGVNGPEVVSDHVLSDILNGVSNTEDLESAFDFRKWLLEQTLTGGRGLAFIERKASGEVVNLWQMDPEQSAVHRTNRRKRYSVSSTAGHISYGADEVLDIPFMLSADGLTHRSPIFTNRRVIGMAQAVTRYAAQYFAGGGVPPFVVTGQFQSGRALDRASDDIDGAVKKAARSTRTVLTLPAGLDIKPLGASAEDSQMIETQRFMIEQIARIYALPPVFLQDLTHGTYSNTEQQDLHLVKHTVKRWVEQIEQQMTLKFFGRGSEYFVEHNLDGLLRGDFKARMEGFARAVQGGVLTPNEARALENRQAKDGGDVLLIQGATVPLTSAGQVKPKPPIEAKPDQDKGESQGDEA